MTTELSNLFTIAEIPNLDDIVLSSGDQSSIRFRKIQSCYRCSMIGQRLYDNTSSVPQAGEPGKDAYHESNVFGKLVMFRWQERGTSSTPRALVGITDSVGKDSASSGCGCDVG